MNAKASQLYRMNMRAIILFFMLAFSGQLYSQDFKVNATRQSWAGGVCCLHGVNYTVTVHTGNLDIDTVKVLNVCIDKKMYTHSKLQYSTTKHSFTVSFGYSADNNKYNTEDNLNKKDSQKSCETIQIVFKLNGEIFSLPIKEIKELFPLAYP